VVIVTDAVAPAGSGATTWQFDEEVVTVVGGRATLPDGTLAGSVITPDDALRALLSIGVDPAVALRSMSTTPAQRLGLGAHDLTPGSAADVVVLDDGWRVHSTLVAGDEVARSVG
jgi:N-acetylglucosamine-6-phosphate deacetylase